MKKIIKTLFFAAALLVVSPKLFAQISVGISIRINPPALPVYTQPACPSDGYIWTPGYWAYDNDNGDYYWVPGVWVSPPQPGYLWTPGYWGYNGDVYVYHRGYWGSHIGFYGGVNYGYGYGGYGYHGGEWVGSSFRYNTAVSNVNTTVVHNTYIDKTVIVNNNTTVNNNTSFNGPGGVATKPRPEEISAMHESHIQATNDQRSHQQTARSDKSQHTSANNGKPATVAMNKVGGDRFDNNGQHNAGNNPGNSNGQDNQHKQPNVNQNTNKPNEVNGQDNPQKPQTDVDHNTNQPNHSGANNHQLKPANVQKAQHAPKATHQHTKQHSGPKKPEKNKE